VKYQLVIEFYAAQNKWKTVVVLFVVKYTKQISPTDDPVTKYPCDDTTNMYFIVQSDYKFISAFPGV
jgi:hypothetical protein